MERDGLARRHSSSGRVEQLLLDEVSPEERAITPVSDDTHSTSASAYFSILDEAASTEAIMCQLSDDESEDQWPDDSSYSRDASPTLYDADDDRGRASPSCTSAGEEGAAAGLRQRPVAESEALTDDELKKQKKKQKKQKKKRKRSRSKHKERPNSADSLDELQGISPDPKPHRSTSPHSARPSPGNLSAPDIAQRLSVPVLSAPSDQLAGGGGEGGEGGSGGSGRKVVHRAVKRLGVRRSGSLSYVPLRHNHRSGSSISAFEEFKERRSSSKKEKRLCASGGGAGSTRSVDRLHAPTPPPHKVRSQPTSPGSSSEAATPREGSDSEAHGVPMSSVAAELSRMVESEAVQRLHAQHYVNLANCRITFSCTMANKMVELYEALGPRPNVFLSQVPTCELVEDSCVLVVPCSGGVVNGWSGTEPVIADLFSRYGKVLRTSLESQINEKYFGELPMGSYILATASPTVYVLFVALSLTRAGATAESYYALVRSSLLAVRMHNSRLAKRAPSDKEWDGAMNAVPIEHIVFGELPVFNVPVPVIAAACELGCRAMIDQTSIVELRVRSMELLMERAGSYSNHSPGDVVVEHVRKQTLVRRGLASIDEATALFKLFLSPDVVLGLRGMREFAELLTTAGHCERDLPFALKRPQMVGALSMNVPAFQRFLEAAINEHINVLTVIEEEDLETQQALGKGGTAGVYKGIWNGYDVAVKKFYESDDRQEFLREASLMSVLCHPNLIRVLGCSRSNIPERFLVMERAKYGSLSRVLHETNEPLSLKRRLLFAIQTCRAVVHLHSLGLIHRDLKADNILVCENMVEKITDYGTMRVVDRTPMTGGVGTSYWMAPEVFEGLQYTEKVDVYSLGMVFFEVFARRVPFSDQAHFSVPVMVVKGKRPSMPSSVPRAMQKLIESMWVPKPTRRPSAQKVLTNLEELLQNERARALPGT
eukprot:TRINITY_DN11377_c0_g1_i1.p1 TRINITY_DN11377_c0_g1~~TRINITY_DN11377_c0_g1_i1.p1  ORF type:complete len:965 (-),score=298.26 TRINITY_DN11377_c0_g1_i1:32-2854(-)